MHSHSSFIDDALVSLRNMLIENDKQTTQNTYDVHSQAVEFIEC